MYRFRAHVFAVFAALIGSGCDTGTTPLGAGGAGSSSQSASSGVMEDPLPCELEAMLDERCGQCHAEEPKFGAMRALVSHDDLVASGDGHDSLAEACIARMTLPSNDEDRMPLAPRSPASQAEIDLLTDFVNAGFPMRGADEICE